MNNTGLSRPVQYKGLWRICRRGDRGKSSLTAGGVVRRRRCGTSFSQALVLRVLCARVDRMFAPVSCVVNLDENLKEP
jgi:hypothetical protein